MHKIFIHFYANLKHSKHIRTDHVPILDSENLSHLRQNRFTLYVRWSLSGYKADLFSLSLFPHTRFSAMPISTMAALASPSDPGQHLVTAGDHVPPLEQRFVPTTPILLLLLPSSSFTGCPRTISCLSAMPLSLLPSCQEDLEGPDRILLALLC